MFDLAIAFRPLRPRVARLKRWLQFVVSTAAVLAGLAALGRAAEPAPIDVAHVLILANSDDPDSLRIARHYADARRVPAANIIALPMPARETITWHEFIPTLWSPLLARLVEERWIDAIPMDLEDGLGRRKYVVNGHRIAALVVCRGVPLRIAHDPTLYAEAQPFTSRAEFRSNAGAVDAELALLTMPEHSINAFILNPLFQNERPSRLELQQVIKVSRLDGPTADDALTLVDRAMAAERDGLAGRAYLDFSDRDPIGNRWLEAVREQLEALHYSLSVDRDPAPMPVTARMDAPALYFGWYAGDVTGPPALPGFRFPPGAIALHIHSYSATTLHSPTSGWVGPLVAQGVTATMGNVYEPYLQLTHRPDLLLRALAKGATLVDAAYYALQALSWQEVLIGDPLYRPFAVSLDRQVATVDRADARFAPYVVLRRANELRAGGHATEALALLRQYQRTNPHLAVEMELADSLRASDPAASDDVLAAAAPRGQLPANEWALVADAAKRLGEQRPRVAVGFWRLLFATPSLPPSLRVAWLPVAIASASASGDTAQAATWQRDLAALAPAPR